MKSTVMRVIVVAAFVLAFAALVVANLDTLEAEEGVWYGWKYIGGGTFHCAPGGSNNCWVPSSTDYDGT